jgi:hypothetical protein
VTFYSGGCAIAGTFTEAADPVAAALLPASACKHRLPLGGLGTATCCEHLPMVT